MPSFYQVLAEVYNGFTEGLDTGGLRQERQWLTALNETDRRPVQTG
jgi:hypothetical protein